MVALFIAEPTGLCTLKLRRGRFTADHPVGANHFHSAEVVIGDAEIVTPQDENGMTDSDGRIPHDDPRWPTHCQCGEPFVSSDTWQVNELDWFEGGGHRFTFGIGSWDGPAGAMIRAKWRDTGGRPPAWIVFLPNSTGWCTNDRAGGVGNYWTVDGDAPNITVSPSIDDQSPSRPWHGWIRNGSMDPC